MILGEIRPRGGERPAITLHPGLTVVRGLDAAARRTWALDVARALRGETTASLDLLVDVDDVRGPLTPELAGRLGLRDAATSVAVFAVDLPGAVPASSSASGSERVAREADVAAAEADVDRLSAELADAERAATAADEEVQEAGRPVAADDTRAEVAAAEARLRMAREAAATARRHLAAVDDAERSAAETQETARLEAEAWLGELEAERAELGSERSALAARLAEAGGPFDPRTVEQALAGLGRLRSVKPRPSGKAAELADRWVAIQAELAARPQGSQPPEWLVTPALAALREARESLVEAEAGASSDSVDPAKVEALDRAHREVLDAEQRAMKKGSRLNRRRLEASHEAEQAALASLGVKTYGEYLQRIAPGLDGGTSSEERIAAAKAALSHAEAVWEELHGGPTSPEWTAAKAQEAALRAEAQALVGDDVPDDELEERLRAHLENVVDTGWAEQALIDALTVVGAAPAPGSDLEAAASAWLAEAPALAAAREALAAELSEVEGKLAAVDERLAELRAAVRSPETEDGATVENPTGPLADLRQAVEEADLAEDEAERALAESTALQQAGDEHRARLADLEQAAEARRNEVDRLRRARDEAEVVRTAARERVDSAADPSAANRDRSADLRAVVAMEAEAYLLARVASLRGVPGGPLPLIVDGEAVGGLPEAAGSRVRRLLGRLAGSMQVVVLDDDRNEIATWAEGLGDRAAVHDVAR